MAKIVRVIGGAVLASEIEAVLTKPSEKRDSSYGRIIIRTKTGGEFTYLEINDKAGAYEAVRVEALRLRKELDWTDVIERPQ